MTEIGSYAFENCSGLTGSLIIPAGVTEIETGVFSGCSELTGNLMIPNGITCIGNYAFSNCSRLIDIEIPESVQKIGAYSFEGRYGDIIKKITILSDNINFDSGSLGTGNIIYGNKGSTVEEYVTDNGSCIFIALNKTPQETEYSVSTVDELLEAVGSDRRIILADGKYDFYGRGWDTRCLIINNIVNLSIEAKNPGMVEFLVPGDWQVIYISNCVGIRISGCILGHDSVSYDGCPADVPVVQINKSSDILIDNCDLYGCGVWGVTCDDSRDIIVNDSMVRDCKEGIINGYGEVHKLDFINCIFSGNAYDENWEYGHNYTAIKRKGVTMDRCMFVNNYNTSLGSDNATLCDCIFYNNAWDGGTPQIYGICLNGITWQVEGTTLKLGYPLQLDADTVRQSEKGKVLDYSDSSLPWRRYEIKDVDTAEGIEYGKNPDKPEDIASGSYKQMNWKIDSAGKLTVTGKGNYADSNSTHNAPWYNYREAVKTAEVSLTDSTCMAYMFEGCKNLTELNLGSFDAVNITDAQGMFEGCTALNKIVCALHLKETVLLPAGTDEIWYLPDKTTVAQLPLNLDKSIVITKGKKPQVTQPYIYASKKKTIYVCGETLNVDDLTVLYYDIDGSVTKTSSYSTNAMDIDMSTAGTKTLTITCDGLTTDIELTVVEKSIAKYYTVTFDTQNHGKAPDAYTDIVAGNKISAPKEPSEEGYKFTGWYKEAECITLWDFDTDVVNSNITLYAGWIQENAPDNPDNPDNPEIPDGIWIARIENCTYTGKAVTPSVEVYYNKKRLTAGRDYTTTYQNNTKAAGSDSAKASAVIVKGRGNYSGTKKAFFTINKIQLTEKDNLKTAKTYPENIKYTPVVISGSNDVLKAGTDYTLTYLDTNGNKLKKQPTQEGNYQMHIVGKGSCEGDIYFSYSVSGSGGVKIINKGTAAISSFTYGSGEPEASLSVDGKKLTRGAEYIVHFTNTGKKGTATATFIGIGDYAGILKKNFKVQAASIQESDISVPKTAAYEKGGAKPKVTVTVNGNELVMNTDYTVSYKNNTKIGNSAKVIVKGKGSYSGSVEKSFSVEPQSLGSEGIKIYVSDAQMGKKPVITVYDANGKKLSIKSDYSAVIDKTGHKVTITGGKNGLYTVQSPIVISYKELSKGKQVTSVTLNKKVGTLPKYFEYTGKEVTLEKDWLTVKAGKTMLKSNEFEIIGYVNNIQNGIATVVIRGTGEYGGIKMFNFKIKTKGL